MATLEDFKRDLPLFLEVGLIAIKQGDEESAKKIFNALGIIAPEHTGKKMGYGLIAMHKMDVKNAQKNFHEILQVEPDNYRAKAFLAFACMLTAVKEVNTDEQLNNLKKSAELSLDVVKNCDSPSTKQLAQSILDWQKELQEKATRGPAG